MMFVIPWLHSSLCASAYFLFRVGSSASINFSTSSIVGFLDDARQSIATMTFEVPLRSDSSCIVGAGVLHGIIFAAVSLTSAGRCPDPGVALDCGCVRGTETTYDPGVGVLCAPCAGIIFRAMWTSGVA